MSELTKAIEEITYSSNRFPEKAFKVITENREEQYHICGKLLNMLMIEG